MPSALVRKLLIYAAVDGLILQPLNHRNQTDQGVKVEYGGRKIFPQYTTATQHHDVESFESQGIIGLLEVSSSAFLISISKSEKVAELWGKPIFLIKDVALIPIESQVEAQKALIKSAQSLHEVAGLKSEQHESPTNNAISDATQHTALGSLEDTWLDDHISGHSVHESSDGSNQDKEPGIAESVISKKGAYGRFTQNWFSRRGWLTGQMRNQGMSSQDDLTNAINPKSSKRLSGAETYNGSESLAVTSKDTTSTPASSGENISEKKLPSLSKEQDITKTLLPKLLQIIRLLLTSDTFYFSYDLDITRDLSHQNQGRSETSLCKLVDPEYFWNSELSMPLMKAGCQDFIVPIMQGFIGQRSFVLASTNDQTHTSDKESPVKEVVKASSDELSSIAEVSKGTNDSKSNQFLLTLISRRSIKRPGLRYLRRGIDDNGNVANSVETEQILSHTSSIVDEPLYSFLQTRGSIPVFFSQTPYTFKPVPTLHGSREANQKAFQKHFSSLKLRYGNVHAVSLVDKHGVELAIGKSYEDHVQLMNEATDNGKPNVTFTWFDFHNICRGMKFENVSQLINSLGPFLSTSKWSTIKSSDQNFSPQSQTQSGIVRTNCMDCLDRTNVVQSAIAQHVLSEQLSEVLHSRVDLQNSPETSWFNALWADNGDAVSRAYAGTAALKGDYTRTRQRNIRGVLTDFSLTLSRYYKNLFDDFFAQAVIDRLLGNVTDSVFTEFESTMTSVDPGIDLEKARQSAITSASTVVVEHDEDFLTGWVLSSPAVVPVGTPMISELRAMPFSHVLLLLSDQALYKVQYDWDAETVNGFERVALDRIHGIQWGTYITGTTNKSQTDTTRNVGLLIKFSDTTHFARVNTKSLENTTSMLREAVQPDGKSGLGTSSQDRFLAFKALSSGSVAVRRRRGSDTSFASDRDAVKHICEEIARSKNAFDRRVELPNQDKSDLDQSKRDTDSTSGINIEEQDIVSLTQAEKSTGYIEHLEYSLKRMVWGR